MRTRADILNELLVLQAQNGEKQAFELLVQRWHHSLYRRAVRLTGNEESARDIVQEVWLAATKGLRRLNDPAKFRGWIYRIVGNKCADHVRKRQVDRRLEAHVVHTAGRVPTNVAEANEMIGSLRTEIRRLPEQQRTVLTLFYLEEMAVREIALILGIPEGTVKSRLYNARKVLKEALED